MAGISEQKRGEEEVEEADGCACYEMEKAFKCGSDECEEEHYMRECLAGRRFVHVGDKCL